MTRRLDWAKDRQRELLLRREEPSHVRDRKPTRRQLDYFRDLWRAKYPGEPCPRPKTRREASDYIDALKGQSPTPRTRRCKREAWRENQQWCTTEEFAVVEDAMSRMVLSG